MSNLSSYNTLDTFFDNWLYPSSFFSGVNVKKQSFTDSVSVADDGSYKLEIEVPGYSREDIAVTAEGNLLKLTLKREDKEEKKLSYRLSSKVDLANIKATCKNGILTIQCPVKESMQPVAINVE